MRKNIAVLDLGSNRIALAVASIGYDGSISINALENTLSRGIKCGEIVDINKVIADITAIRDKIQKEKGVKRLKKIFAVTKGVDVKTEPSRGMISLSRSPREITKRDIEKCLDMTTMMRLPLERTIVGKTIKGFYVDGGKQGISNPIGLYGIKLEAEAFVTTAPTSKIHNLTKCIDHAGLLLEGTHLSGEAVASSVLDVAEKEKGVLLLDIGDLLTEAIIFKNRLLKEFWMIEKGAGTILDENKHIIPEKLNILLENIASTVKQTNEEFTSVVVTGGGALLDGIIEKVEAALNCPTKIGIAKIKGVNLSLQNAIIHAGTIGLIKQLASDYKNAHSHKNPFRKFSRKLLDIYESYF